MVSAFQVTMTVRLWALGESFPSQILSLFSAVVTIASYFPRLAHRIMARLKPITAIISVPLYAK